MPQIPTPAPPPASVWKIHAIETSANTVVMGTILEGLPKLIETDERAFSNFSKMLRSYFTRPLAHTEIEIEIGEKKMSARTDAHGNFQVVIPESPTQDITVSLASSGAILPRLQTYPALFPQTDAPYLVVSDIDDTILVTHTHSLFAKLKVMLFDAPADRKAVEATRLAFELLDSDKVQFLYLSRSEINLFHLIGDFLRHQKIPLGPLLLRNYVRWSSLLAKKDMQYKFRRMEWVVNAFPDKKLLFFGDDSQQDLEVFTHIAAQYGERVRSIFIRRTGTASKNQEEQLSKHSDFPVTHYDQFSDISVHLQTLMDEIATSP